MRSEAFTVPLRYNTLPSLENRIDASDLGLSLRGVARVSNIIAHFLYVGHVPERRTYIEVRFFVGPPKKGSVNFELAALLGAAQLPIWWDTFSHLALPLFGYIIAAVFYGRLGRDVEKEKMLEIIADQIARDDSFRTLVHLSHMEDKAWPKEHIDKITNRGERSMRDAVAPVNRSSDPLDIGNVAQDRGITLDEASAEVIRAKKLLKVGDQSDFTVQLLAVDKVARRCKIKMSDQEGEVMSNITDPNLMETGNIYTEALHNGTLISVQAKPVLEEGEIRTLYISDGRRK